MDRPRIVVTAEKFDRIFSIDDWFNFNKLKVNEMYEYMLKFVEDESGNPLPEEDAREMFKKIPKAEFNEYLADFMKGINQAFVNPTNGSS